MKIGYFFGTFNPIHNGHLAIANYVVEHTDIDKVIFVVSPNSPFKEHKNCLLDFKYRCNLINEAIENNDKLGYSSIEATLIDKYKVDKCYTFDTLRELKDIYGVISEIVLILGEDNFADIENFLNYNSILRNFEIYVCPRTEKLIKYDFKVTEFKEFGKIKGVNFLNSMPINTVSSTFIRNEVKNRHLNTISTLLPTKVFKTIKNNNYYV